MENYEPNEPNEHQNDPGGEQTPEANESSGRDGPRIYVASLSDYNNGVLHGAWLDADTMPDQLLESINEVLSTSPTGDAEEFAIFDYEGFGPWRPGEYESIATVALVASGMEDHGMAFAHWVDLRGDVDPDDLARFEDAYLGHWSSVLKYAEELIDDCMPIDLSNIPDALAGYVTFDYEGFARDLELSGDVTTSEGDGGVYVFDGRL